MREVRVADAVNAKKMLNRIHIRVQQMPRRLFGTCQAAVRTTTRDSIFVRHLVTISNCGAGHTGPVKSIVYARQISLGKHVVVPSSSFFLEQPYHVGGDCRQHYPEQELTPYYRTAESANDCIGRG